MSAIDISVIVTLHREGLIAKPALDSVKRAVAEAVACGQRCEVLTILDQPDTTTSGIVEGQSDPDWQSFVVDCGDPGLSRNFGAHEARGRMVAYLDGDDMFGANWLAACGAASRARPHGVAWRPEVNIYFGEASMLYRHIDMESPEFDLFDLGFSNLWTALVCTERKIVLETPFARSDIQNGIGFEDWAWNCATVEKGVVHKVVPGTGHAIRVKPDNTSVLRRTSNARAAPPPTSLFRRLFGQVGGTP